MGEKAGPRVDVPVGTTELDQVRDLMRAFVTWHRERHPDDAELINQYFDVTAFEEELASLRESMARRAERFFWPRTKVMRRVASRYGRLMPIAAK